MMRKALFLAVISLISVTVSGQDISGKWNGLLSVQGTDLRVDFNLTKTDNGYTATLDSPDQNAYGIPVTSVSFKKPDITIVISDIGAEYKGKLTKDDLIEGTFTQMGQAFPMNLKKKKAE